MTSERGIRWILEGDTPTFDAGDEWSGETTPSRDIVELIPGLLLGLRSVPGGLLLPAADGVAGVPRTRCCWLVRWELIVKRGLAADRTWSNITLRARRTSSLMGWSLQRLAAGGPAGRLQDDPQFGKNGKALVFPIFVKPALTKPAFGSPDVAA